MIHRQLRTISADSPPARMVRGCASRAVPVCITGIIGVLPAKFCINIQRIDIGNIALDLVIPGRRRCAIRIRKTFCGLRISLVVDEYGVVMGNDTGTI